MVKPTTPPKNGFVRVMRKVYNPMGFAKGYNFTLCTSPPYARHIIHILRTTPLANPLTLSLDFIFAGALFGFTLARLMYLDVANRFCPPNPTAGSGAGPGECYWYNQPRYRIGILIHLATILPASLLVILQFLPVIRHKFILYHRIAGYVIILCVILTVGSAFAIGDKSFGGTLTTRMAVGVIGLSGLGSIFLAYYNIKRLQIEQHRAWMLRAWFYMASIITLRLIMFLTSLIVSKYPEGSTGTIYEAIGCPELMFMYAKNMTNMLSVYPECDPTLPGYDTKHVAVQALFPGKQEQIAASLRIGFPAAAWLAFFLHAIGVEIYLNLTKAETERLRNVSYKRQLERGFKHPGSAGLVAERLGDCKPWIPEEEQETKKRFPEEENGDYMLGNGVRR